MDPISNTDRLILLLRQKLEERAKASASNRSKAKTSGSVGTPSPTVGIRAALPVEGVDERPFRRALIQNLLGDQFGQELINDAQFQQVVSRVAEAIEDDPVTSQLLSRVIGELRS